MMPSSASHDEFGELSNLVAAARAEDATTRGTGLQTTSPKSAPGFMVTGGDRPLTADVPSSSLYYNNGEHRTSDAMQHHQNAWSHQPVGHAHHNHQHHHAAGMGVHGVTPSNSSLNATAAPFRVREGRGGTVSSSGTSGVGVQKSFASIHQLFSMPPPGPMVGGGPSFSGRGTHPAVASTWPPISPSPGGGYRCGGAVASPPPPPPALPMEWVKQFLVSHPHLVTVQNLEPRTTKKQLWHIFYPMGATDAAVLAPTMHTVSGAGGSSRRSVGVVMFSSSEMAKIAAEKLNDFVPHGQSFPLVVTFVGGGASSQTGDAQPASVISSVNSSIETATPSQCSSSSAPIAPDANAANQDVQKLLANTDASHTNVELLNLLTSVVSRQGAAADDIALLLLTMIRRRQGTRTLVEDAVRIIRDQIVFMGAHSSIFTPPLVGALQKLVDGMEQSGAVDATQHALELYSGFKRFFSQSMLQLLLNLTADKGCRCVAGVTIGHLFDLDFLAGGSPFAMARKLIASNEVAISAARRYMDASSGSVDHAVHAPWVNLVESLIAMTSSWASRHPARDATDENEVHFQAFVKQFYGHEEDDQASSTFSHGGGAGTPRREETLQTKQTPPPTPSSRPTPTSAIVSRVSPAKSSQNSTPRGHHQAGLFQNSPRSECGATPLDMSVESNTGCASAHPPIGASGPTTTALFSATAPGLWQPAQRIGLHQRSSVREGTPSATSGAVAQGSAQQHQVTYETTLQKDLLACTVYLTKLPGGLTDAKVRRLIAQFGEFNKVRMYKEKTPPAIRGSSSLASSSHQARGCFGFVEYAHASSAKAIIDYFRNASMTSTAPFHFLTGSNPSTQFSAEEIALLAQTRASYAKSAIHDQHPKDAVFEPTLSGAASAPPSSLGAGGGQQIANIKVQPCTFGLPNQPDQHQQQHQQQQNVVATAAPAGAASLPTTRLALPSPVQHPHHGGAMVFADNAHFPRGHLEHNSSSNTYDGSKTPSGRSLYMDPCTHPQRDGGASLSEPAALRLGFFDSSDTTW